MKKRIISFLIIVTFIFTFVIFYKGLNKSSFYEPKSEIKEIPKFFSKLSTFWFQFTDFKYFI